MSAFIVNPEHVTELALFAVGRQFGGSFRVPAATLPRLADQEGPWTDQELATEYANILWRENVRSVQARYPEDSWADLPGPCEKPDNITIHSMLRRVTDPVHILKMCDGLEYQSCETEDWDQTEAHTLLQAIRHAAIGTLPGYDDAPWSYYPQEPTPTPAPTPTPEPARAGRYVDTNEATARIRSVLRRDCPTLHVRHGRGTGYCWIDISGSDGKGGTFTAAERSFLKGLGFNIGANCCGIAPEDQAYWLDKLNA